ncbi:chondroitinase-B domain-containing protein [Lutibacter citreus]|uniref:chondroitinase-B domain-containing protein n=1 Tax=Lutibacter citreus TaxID=2138210 RepID=UPI000DBE410F|nr:chondroitinase-B domain-containing protein [Lutibacter citreus]
MRKNYSQKILFFSIVFAFLLSSININSQTTYNINDPEELEDQTYVAGDEIILANGVYDTDERIDFVGNGTADNPITFRAESPGGVVFTGGLAMNIGGDYVVVDGFHWQGGYGASNFIQFRNGSTYANHSTIQNCAIDGLALSPDEIADDGTTSITKHRWIVLYGTYNSVINCSFMNKASAGALVLVELGYNASPDNGVTNTRCNVVGHTISNNYFYKYDKIDNTLSNSGDSETIRIGSSGDQNVNSSTTVSNNYFVETDGENEIITNKSKNNTFINNTFRRCRGSLVLRHGSNATVNGNYFLGEDIEGTGGVRISDSNHSITNNYIQDCINVASQAQWNNGITFIGGNDNAAVVCSATSGITNGYQKVENINLSNNTIINTNAPLYFNTAKGSTDPTGTVDNNLIYFAASDSNLTDVIKGDYTSLGTALSYSGNVYNGSDLGVTNTGFSDDTGITAIADGEIFTFTGAGSKDKGADMGAYMPTTDGMVGYGIGACFLNNLGANISDGTCTIVIGEYLTVSSLPTFTNVASSNNVSINTNVSWTATSNDSWITIDKSSGNGNETISVSVTENVNTSSRTGSVTFTQDAGGDDIVRDLNVIQESAPRLNLINDGSVADPVTINFVSKENTSKSELAINSLDKDMGSVWTADDGAVLNGDYKGDGEFVIYDLGSSYTLDFIQFNTTNKSDAFGIQILVSTTGTDLSDFSIILPETGDLLLTATGTTEFNKYEVNTDARYVKLIGYGRFNSAGDTRASAWSAIGEIEFYGNEAGLSGDDDQDGVMNNTDKCSNTLLGEIVDVNGCSDSQLDDDSDGVMNNIDQCNNTTAGANVNELGCFTLLENNFKIETVGETCPDKDNGKIIISAIENLNYSTMINGIEYNFNDTLEVDNLAPKTYEFCIEVDGESYEQCFNVTIESGTTVLGKTSILLNKVTIDITQGSAPFNIYLNGQELFQTLNNSFSVDVVQGDLIQVKTDVNCEGIFSKKIDLFESITAYPNPTKGKISINIPSGKKEVIIELYNIYSQLILSKTYTINYGKVEIDIENMSTGIYLAKVMLDKPVTIKIVRH